MGAGRQSRDWGIWFVKNLNISLHRQNPLANLTVGPPSRLPPRSVLLDFVQWLPPATRTRKAWEAFVQNDFNATASGF